MTNPAPHIVWFRQDLRVADNPALASACAAGGPVVALYVLDDGAPGEWAPGGAARWWLHHSLAALKARLGEFGIPLILRRGDAADIVTSLVEEIGAAGVHWNRCYEPYAIRRDAALKASLKDSGIDTRSFNAALLYEPWTVKTKAGGFFKVYTRFWHAVRDAGDPEPPRGAPAYRQSSAAVPKIPSDALDSWTLLPTRPDWAGGLRDRWQPGEAAAMAHFEAFLDGGLKGYKDGRNFPAQTVTSTLSPYLHFGDIGPRQVWKMVVDKAGWTADSETFLKEVVWREFAYHVFYHLPDLPAEPMYDRFAEFPWQDDPAALAAWQAGRTGYPMVDAGMRELWQTGHMHNRVRMITASFLVKHLLQPWQAGEAWFWDTLVDADLAVNAFSWQWVAGCGADAAPYFRIFNPIIQGAKFDPDGSYIRTYVPEIAALPDKYLFAPWEAPEDILADAGIVLGKTYPHPIVAHGAARDRAMAAFKALPPNSAD